MKRKLSKKMIVSIGILTIATIINACNSTEIEERCFPMLVVVDYDDDWKQVLYCDDFPRTNNTNTESKGTSTEEKKDKLSNSLQSGKTFAESKKAFEARLNKIPDYNHLKMILLDEEFVQQQTLYNDMLDTLVTTEEFPRNTYVCITDDVGDFLELADGLEDDLGTYLEQYLEHHEEKKDRLLTLGDLLDEKANQDMIVYVPYLEVENNYIEWGGYYAIGENQNPVNMK